MKLSTFELFAEELRTWGDESGEFASAELYYRHSGVWYNETQTRVGNESLIKDLERTVSSVGHWRHTSSEYAYFFVDELDAVARLDLKRQSTTTRRDRILRSIKECVQRAQNRFRATHDPDTGLLNASALREYVDEQLKTKGQEREPRIPEVVDQTQLAFLLLDIDHFKQVNDEYGHPFGDVVLQALAIRLEAIAEAVEVERSGFDELRVARLGGEEFGIIISGRAVGKSAVESFAETVRSSVGRDPAPTADELDKCSWSEEVRIPPENERYVTVSVGAAQLAPSESNPYDSMRERADGALYYAKRAGRDAVCHYQDIISHYGKVLEHHEETGFVAIDLGRSVGVRRGQEFRVYHPDFTGDVPFVRDDGRTRRTLGTYPRVAMGRITVFQAQEEMSFCKVTSQEPKETFPSGSTLEAIPLGSIAHLVGDRGSLDVAPTAPGRKEISEAVSEALEEGTTPHTIVWSVGNEDELTERYGGHYVNESLAHLYEAVSNAAPRSATVGQARSMEVIAVLPEDITGGIGEWVGDIAKKLDEDRPEVDYSIGIYDGLAAFDDVSPSLEPQQLAEENAVEFARLALARSRQVGETVVFRPGVPVSILVSLRSDGEFEQVLHDFKEMTSLGLKSAFLCNQRALALYSMGRLDEASEGAEAAVELSPQQSLLWANLAFFQAVSGLNQKSYDSFQKFFEVATEEAELPDVYWPVYAVVRTDLWMEGAIDMPRDEIEEILLDSLKYTREAGLSSLEKQLVSRLYDLKAGEDIEAR